MYFTGITIAAMTFLTIGIPSSSKQNITGAPVLGSSICLSASAVAWLPCSWRMSISHRSSVFSEHRLFGASANSLSRKSV